MIRIALLFPLPQEYGCFKRRMGSWRLRSRKPFKHFTYSKGGQGGFDPKELILIETGMGHKRTLEALEWLLGWFRPDLVIAAGFAGSLAQHLTVGEVCLGEVVASLDIPPDSKIEHWVNRKFSEGLTHFWGEHRIRRTRIVTAIQPKPKQPLSEEYADLPSIIDMETYFVAKFCCRKELPFLSLRAVSDALLDEIDFDLTTISDARGHVRLPLVLASVLRSPKLLKSYYLSWKRSRIAATNLGEALRDLLDLPPAEMRTLLSSSGGW